MIEESSKFKTQNSKLKAQSSKQLQVPNSKGGLDRGVGRWLGWII
jgi:hypothetical protein